MDFDVLLVFQPCYSPEYNACERVFGYVKDRLRSSRSERVSLISQISVVLATISLNMMVNWYQRAILGRLP